MEEPTPNLVTDIHHYNMFVPWPLPISQTSCSCSCSLHLQQLNFNVSFREDKVSIGCNNEITPTFYIGTFILWMYLMYLYFVYFPCRQHLPSWILSGTTWVNTSVNLRFYWCNLEFHVYINVHILTSSEGMAFNK